GALAGLLPAQMQEWSELNFYCDLISPVARNILFRILPVRVVKPNARMVILVSPYCYTDRRKALVSREVACREKAAAREISPVIIASGEFNPVAGRRPQG